VFTSLNLLLLLTLKDVPSGASKTESPLHVLWRTITNILEPRLVAFMAIMSCFWLMMYQLWDLQPNFIADWTDSRSMAAGLQWLPPKLQQVFFDTTPRGQMMHQQVLLSCNAFFIILGVVGMAWLTRKMRTLEAMLIGMMMATVGVLVAGWTTSAWMLVLGIGFFSLGEMMTGPKKSEYLALIAPPGKKGLYLGYVNIPVGVGVYAGSTIAGYIYGRYGEKAVLALKYLATQTPFGQGKGWDGNVATLEAVLGVKRTEAMAKLQEATGLDPVAATQRLWDTYHPQYVWLPFALIGVVAAIALWVFGRMAKRWSDMNA
jgi:POT family proton-dependent oligopeptide transporter